MCTVYLNLPMTQLTQECAYMRCLLCYVLLSWNKLQWRLKACGAQHCPFADYQQPHAHQSILHSSAAPLRIHLDLSSSERSENDVM